ncbi:hypothetical protein BH11PSE11_BH11PSE11_37780 [soil metagenome]
MTDVHAGPLRTALTQILNESGADMVLLGEYLEKPVPRIRTLACCIDGLWQDNFSYKLAGHPSLQTHAKGAFSIAGIDEASHPEAYLLLDYGMTAYAGQMVTMNGGEFTGILVAMRRTPFADIAATEHALATLAASLSRQQEALLREVEHERFAFASHVRDEMFREYVLNNDEGFTFLEVMPPVSLDLPHPKLIHRLIHTSHVVECNRAIARMHGYASPEAMLGTTPYDINGPEKAFKIAVAWVANNCELRDLESQAVDAEGKITWVRGNSTSKKLNGKIYNFWTRRLDITNQKRYETAIQHKAHHDALTGLPNRYWFQERAGVLAKDHIERGKKYCLGVLDLNGFKEINDTLGHVVGDQLLQAVAVRLLQGLKPHGAEIARLGGDEFAILMPDTSEQSQGESMANTVQQLLRTPFSIEGMNLHIGGALGLTLLDSLGESSTDMLRRADIAMYAAKNEGRGFCWYLPEFDLHSRRRLSLISTLQEAIDRNELFLEYQPKIDLSDSRLNGFEALVRWQHPEHGLIMPADFIPLAETNEVIGSLTRWVLLEAIRQCARWHEAGLEISIAINISARNLSDETLDGYLADCLALHDFPASCVELELTESALMTHPGQAMEILQALRTRGLRIAIDDFGTGYSSLAYLARLPVSTLKVDQTFVRNMVRSKSDEQIVRSVIGLAHQCDLRVVAEGVEDEATLFALLRMGCDLAQGYLISAPMTVAEADRWIEDHQASAKDRSFLNRRS